MRYLPVLIAAIVIASAAAFDLSVNVGGDAEVWAPVIEQGVPLEVGPWTGVDLEVDDKIAFAAGAVGKVSRRYTNQDTGDVVDVWLICGHMQAVARHTPNVCYRAVGYTQPNAQDRYTFDAEGPAGENEFWTTQFLRQRQGELPERKRVFWAWTQPKVGESATWSAPGKPRYAFPGVKALCKMYFTTVEEEDVNDVDLSENPSNDLANRLLPLLTELFKAGPDNFQAAPAAAGTSDDSPTPGVADPEA